MGWTLFFLLLIGLICGPIIQMVLYSTLGIEIGNFCWGQTLLYIMSFLPSLLYLLYLYKKEALPKPHVGEISFSIIPLSLLSLLSLSVVVSSLPLGDYPVWYLERLKTMVSDNNLFWSIMGVSVIAPVCEELIFRRVILVDLLTRNKPAVAILISSLLFGVVHLNWWQGVTATIYGLFFGWLYFKTKKISITILLHSVNNSISILLAYLFAEDISKIARPLGEIVVEPSLFYPIIIVSIVIFAVSIYILNKINRTPFK